MAELAGLLRPARVQVLTARPNDQAGRKVLVFGVFAAEPLTAAGLEPELADQLREADVRRGLGELTQGYHRGDGWLLVGLGPRPDFDRNRARKVAQLVHARAEQLERPTLHWRIPAGVSDGALTGLVEGAVLSGHPPDRYRTQRESPVVDLTVLIDDPAQRAQLIERAVVIADTQNRARDLQNAPANLLTPRDLAARAVELANEVPGLSVEILDEAELRQRGMGAFASVASGSLEPAQLIQLRYEGPDARGPLTGWIGKAVTYDSGGLSLKRGPGMAEMKFDMSGGAAVIEAIGAVARLRLPVRILAIAGATENMPGERATRPGDIIRSLNGLTVEITNTDAEGRLVLADCITHAIGEGAERLVDIASLTGTVVTIFDGRYAALFANDEEWAAQVSAAGLASGELVWRLPLHPDYAERIKGRYADLANYQADKEAGTILAAEFLHRFAGDIPWAHIDALAWNLEHEPVTIGGAGFGVRLLVELASHTAELSQHTELGIDADPTRRSGR